MPSKPPHPRSAGTDAALSRFHFCQTWNHSSPDKEVSGWGASQPPTEIKCAVGRSFCRRVCATRAMHSKSKEFSMVELAARFTENQIITFTPSSADCTICVSLQVGAYPTIKLPSGRLCVADTQLIGKATAIRDASTLGRNMLSAILYKGAYNGLCLCVSCLLVVICCYKRFLSVKVVVITLQATFCAQTVLLWQPNHCQNLPAIVPRACRSAQRTGHRSKRMSMKRRSTHILTPNWAKVDTITRTFRVGIMASPQPVG